MQYTLAISKALREGGERMLCVLLDVVCIVLLASGAIGLLNIIRNR